MEEGVVDIVFAGGAESICKVTLAGFNALRAVDPEFCRPFHRGRQGLSLGEGACVFVLERESDARQRGATPWARILASGESCDAHHMTQPDGEGRGAELAMRRALNRSQRVPSEVALVECHGTGTPHNDLAESQAVARLFGRNLRAVTAVKGNIGHTLGAAGAFGLLSVVESLRTGWLR